MASRRKNFTLESNIPKVIKKIEEKPQKVMNIIGSSLAKEIRTTTLKSQYKTRYSMIAKSLGYWARKREKDLQIGFKMSIVANKYGAGPGIVGGIMSGAEADPIKPVVLKNAELIKDMIAVALKEIERE